MNVNGQLTATVKNAITEDWQRAFPTLGVFKPMWLAKRHGPLLLGLVLDRTRSNDVYVPKFHVHNLLAPSRAILLSLVLSVPDLRQPKLPRQIKVVKHAKEYPAAVSFLSSAVPELGMARLSWAQIVDLHCNFIRQKRDYAVAKLCSQIFADVILLAHWFGHSDYAQRCLDDAVNLMGTWVPVVDVAIWRQTLKALTSCEGMTKTLHDELAKHKVQNLPVFDLEDDGSEVPLITDVYRAAWS